MALSPKKSLGRTVYLWGWTGTFHAQFHPRRNDNYCRAQLQPSPLKLVGACAGSLGRANSTFDLRNCPQPSHRSQDRTYANRRKPDLFLDMSPASFILLNSWIQSRKQRINYCRSTNSS